MTRNPGLILDEANSFWVCLLLERRVDLESDLGVSTFWIFLATGPVGVPVDFLCDVLVLETGDGTRNSGLDCCAYNGRADFFIDLLFRQRHVQKAPSKIPFQHSS